MKLHVIVGYREYLTPTQLGTKQLRTLLEPIEPGVVVPTASWLPLEAGPYVGPALFAASADPVEQDRRIDLLLEYVADHAAPNANVAVAVPFESYLAAPALGLADARTQRLCRRAVERFGEADVVICNLYWNDNTQAVLDALRDGPGEDVDGSLRPISHALAGVAAETGRGAELERNYHRAVVHAAYRRRPKGIFEGSGRPALVAEYMDRVEMRIGTSATPEQVLAELGPDGALGQLFHQALPT